MTAQDKWLDDNQVPPALRKARWIRVADIPAHNAAHRNGMTPDPEACERGGHLLLPFSVDRLQRYIPCVQCGVRLEREYVVRFGPETGFVATAALEYPLPEMPDGVVVPDPRIEVLA